MTMLLYLAEEGISSDLLRTGIGIWFGGGGVVVLPVLRLGLGFEFKQTLMWELLMEFIFYRTGNSLWGRISCLI